MKSGPASGRMWGILSPASWVGQALALSRVLVLHHLLITISLSLPLSLPTALCSDCYFSFEDARAKFARPYRAGCKLKAPSQTPASDQLLGLPSSAEPLLSAGARASKRCHGASILTSEAPRRENLWLLIAFINRANDEPPRAPIALARSCIIHFWFGRWFARAVLQLFVRIRRNNDVLRDVKINTAKLDDLLTGVT